MSHSFLRNATRLFGFLETYRLVDVHASQRKKKTAVFHNGKDSHVSQRKRKALRFTAKEKNTAFHSEREKHCVSQRKKTATFHNGAVSSENTN